MTIYIFRKLAVIFAIFSTAEVTYAVMTYDFVGSGFTSDETVSGKAHFELDAGRAVLTLANTTAHTASADQLLTAVEFTLYNAETGAINTATLSAATAIPRSVAADGTYTDGPSTNIINSWEKKITGNQYQLNFNPDARYAIVGPADGELGPVAGVYTANGSINGNLEHNPFVAKSGTFVLTDASISDATEVKNVRFIYNTGLSFGIPGMRVAAAATPVPEPTTVLVFGLGLGAACYLHARRQREAVRALREGVA